MRTPGGLAAALVAALPGRVAHAQGVEVETPTAGNLLPSLSASAGVAEAPDGWLGGPWWLPLALLGATAAIVAVIGATRGTRPFSRAWAARAAAATLVILVVAGYAAAGILARDPDERARYQPPALDALRVEPPPSP
jgi:hypothetical protein